MELEPEQRILGRPNENVEIRQKAGRKTYKESMAHLLLVARSGSRESRASQSLGNWVHAGQLCKAMAAKVTTTGT